MSTRSRSYAAAAAFCLGALIGLPTPAAAQVSTSASFQLTDQGFTAAGGGAGSASFTAQMCVAPEVVAAGYSSSTSFQLQAGGAAVVPEPACGNGTVEPPEHCDDGNPTAADGCEPDCTFTPESLSGTAAPGGSLTTDSETDGAQPLDPIETTVTTPNAGAVSIAETGVTEIPEGYNILGQQVLISAPDATPSQPLELVFDVDATQIPDGLGPNDIELFKDGTLVDDCTGAPGEAEPDPCVRARSLLGGGDVRIEALSSTASTWVLAVPVPCGDAIVDAGEECDDGNTNSGDGCSATCQIEVAQLSPGGRGSVDCLHEWWVLPTPPANASGIPGKKLACTVDDPGCDAGPAGDGACTFRVALCFNVDDTRFACTPSNVERLLLKRPAHATPADATDRANRDAIERALAVFGGIPRGQCTAPGASRGRLCTADSECDNSPGNGACGGRLIGFTPVVSATDRCTPFASITVPLGANGQRGKRVLKVKVSPTDSPSDTDKLRLLCDPAP